MKSTRQFANLTIVGLLSSLVVVGGSSPARADQVSRPDTALVSKALNGGPANDASDRPQISGDGRFVTYDSYATNLVEGVSTADRVRRVYRTDVVTGTTVPVSVSNQGSIANSWSSFSWPSDDGSLVAFVSDATALSPVKASKRSVYVRNMTTGVTELVSINDSNVAANGSASRPMMSGDGRYVAFNSSASNLAAQGGNSVEQVYLRDRLARTTTLVSVSTTGGLGNGVSYRGITSADGRWVSWASKATNLATSASPPGESLYIRDMQAGVTYRVSSRIDGSAAGASRPYMTPDAAYVSFNSNDLLTPGDVKGTSDTFLWNHTTGATERLGSSAVTDDSDVLNGDSLRVFVSDDARYALWNSFSNNLVPNDYNPAGDVFLLDRTSSVFTLLSQSWYGGAANGASYRPVLNNDASKVAYLSRARNLVKDDPSNDWQVYLVTPSTVSSVPDTSAPQLSGSSPVGGSTVMTTSPVSFGGTVTDDRAIDRVTIQIRNRTSGLYLQADGTWGSAAVQLPTSLSDRYNTSSTWGYSTQLTPGSYSFTSVAWDAGNNKTASALTSFTASDQSPDTVKPTLSVTSPLAGATNASPVSFTGSATDDRGVTRGFVSVRDNSTLLWLQADGSWASSPGRLTSSLGASGAVTTDWTLTLSLPNGTYGWEAGVYDAAGNLSNKPFQRLVVTTP